MDTKQEVKQTKRYGRLSNAIFGVLFLIFITLLILWQTNKGAIFYIHPPFVFEFKVAVIGYGVLLFIGIIFFYMKRLLKYMLWRIFVVIFFIGTLLCCSVGWLLVSVKDTPVSYLSHSASLNFQNHRYHLDEQEDAIWMWEIGESPLTFIVWECDQFGIVCRQLESILTDHWSRDAINAHLEINRETNQLMVIIEDIRYVVKDAEQ